MGGEGADERANGVRLACDLRSAASVAEVRSQSGTDFLDKRSVDGLQEFALRVGCAQ